MSRTIELDRLARVTIYTTLEVMKATRLSKSTLVRWEKDGVFPKPKRLARTRARIWTQEHVDRILAEKNRVEDEPEPQEAK